MSNTPISPHSKLVEEAVRAVGSRDRDIRHLIFMKISSNHRFRVPSCVLKTKG